MLSNSVTSDVAEGVELKSMYASSTMISPWYDGSEASFRISDNGIDLDVGFPGEHTNRSFVCGVTALSIYRQEEMLDDEVLRYHTIKLQYIS